MAFFNKKADPISERSKALNAQIASLEAQIKKLDQQIQQGPEEPRLRPNQLPRRHGQTPLREPIFEPVDHRRLQPAVLFNHVGWQHPLQALHPNKSVPQA